MTKKHFGILLAFFCMLGLASCKEDTRSVPVTDAPDPEESVVVGEAAAPGDDLMFGLPNPMVPVTDPQEFDMVLGIPLEVSVLSDETACTIISGQMADVRWHREIANGEDTELCLRATKNESMASVMHGIYDEKMSDPVTVHTNPGSDDDIQVTLQDALTEKISIVTWEKGGTWYSLTYDVGLSQMTAAAVLDSCMMATGAVRIPVRVAPIPETLDLSHLPDGAYAAEFSPEALTEKEGTYELRAEVFTPEFFDLLEVTMMVSGDILLSDGEETVCETVDLVEENGGTVVLLNGGLATGGIELRTCEGGNCRVTGFDDTTSYQNHGEAVLPVSKELVLTDGTDPTRKKPKTVSGPKKISSYLRDTEDLFVTRHNARITVSEGQLSSIEISYLP